MMMKSEERMSKKDVNIKRRLDSLFGEFSDFIPNRQDQDQSRPERDEPSPPLASNSPNNMEAANEHRVEMSHEEEPQQNGSSTDASSNIDTMIGQIMNVPRPLSPVTQIESTNIKKETRNEGPPKGTTKIPMDLETIIEQISRVSPLLSPINFGLLSPDSKGAVQSLEADESKNKVESPHIKEKDDSRRKRPNNEEPKEENNRKKKAKEENNREKKVEECYSIKMDSQLFQKLLDKLNCSSAQQNGDQKRAESGIPTKSKTDSSVTTVPETVFSTESNALLENGELKSKISFTVPHRKSPADYFPGHAREIKKRAEQERDRLQQVLLYFESIAYCIMASTTLASKLDKMHSSIADSSNLLNSSWTSFKRHKIADNGPVNSIRTRLKYLQMMVSACLAYQLYSIRSPQAFNAYNVLSNYEKENPAANRRPASRTNGNDSAAGGNTGVNGGPTVATPSPAASTPGSLNSSSTVTLPVDIYNTMSTQIRTLHHLMWSFKLWNDAKNHPADCKKFMERLAGLCGELKQDSGLVDVAEYLLTAVHLLRRECNQQQRHQQEGAASS